jgi:large subunit ribosomal protein L21
MKYAVFKFQGHQFKVKKGDEVDLDKLGLEEGKKIKFADVLLLVDDEKVAIGQPVLPGVVVEAKVLANFKGKKIRVATFKAKSRYRRVKGFRAQLTKVKIEKITAPKKKK